MSQPVRDIERAELPNGLVVVTEKMPHLRSVSVGIWQGTDSRGKSHAPVLKHRTCERLSGLQASDAEQRQRDALQPHFATRRVIPFLKGMCAAAAPACPKRNCRNAER
jgi:hypothetical protein